MKQHLFLNSVNEIIKSWAIHYYSFGNWSHLEEKITLSPRLYNLQKLTQNPNWDFSAQSFTGT